MREQMAKAIGSIARKEMRENIDEITWQCMEKGQITNKRVHILLMGKLKTILRSSFTHLLYPFDL